MRNNEPGGAMRVARAASSVAVGALVWTLWSSWGFDGRSPVWRVVADGLTAAAAAWTVWASEDQTGLYLVGALLVALGIGAGLSVVAAIAAVAGRRSRPGTQAPR